MLGMIWCFGFFYLELHDEGSQQKHEMLLALDMLREIVLRPGSCYCCHIYLKFSFLSLKLNIFTKGDSPDSALVRHLKVLSCNTAAYFHVYKPLEKSLKCQ